MGDVRNRLDRKSELRLYEWMKNQDNYGKLSDKTVGEGARAVSNELGMEVSSSVLVGLVQAMALEPFWKTRGGNNKKAEVVQTQPVDMAVLSDLRAMAEANGKRIDGLEHAIMQFKEVCNNMLRRIEDAEMRSAGGEPPSKPNGPREHKRREGGNSAHAA